MRNHDELTLDKLSEDERAEVFARFGPDPEYQLYGRGLRRRLPTMLDGDQRAIRMAYSLAFSLPGTPVLFYGEEIGMAENLAIEGRYAVRPPMQWADDGGFTEADEGRRPMVEGEWGPQRVNVAAQRRDPGSLLNWFERLIRRRRECPELGFGALTVLDTVDTRPRPPLRLGRRDRRRRPRARRQAGHDRAADRRRGRARRPLRGRHPPAPGHARPRALRRPLVPDPPRRHPPPAVNPHPTLKGV